MSPTPNHAEAGRLNLQRALGELPVHEPEASLWPRIADQLAAEQAIARALPALPVHEPADALWTAIAADLSAPAASPLTVVAEPARPAVRLLWPTYRVAAGLAAAVLVGLLVWWPRPQPTATATTSAPRETITYSMEEEVEAEPAPARTAAAFDPLDQQGVAFIDAHCSSLPTVCQSDEFRELRTQLTELETEEQRLHRDLRRLGSTPELVRHQVRVTTLKATVTRELIQLLIS
jgi:hypothetical protein